MRNRTWTTLIERHNLAGRKFTFQGSANGCQRATLRRHHPSAISEIPVAERVQPPWVTHGIEGVARQNSETVGAFGTDHEDAQFLFPRATLAASQHLDNHFAVARRGQPNAPLQQFAPHCGAFVRFPL
jgi:hypothetical protein